MYDVRIQFDVNATYKIGLSHVLNGLENRKLSEILHTDTKLYNHVKITFKYLFSICASHFLTSCKIINQQFFSFRFVLYFYTPSTYCIDIHWSFLFSKGSTLHI